MDSEEGVFDELRFGPLSGFRAVMGFNVAIDCVECKSRLGKIPLLDLPSRTLKPRLAQSMGY